MTEHQKILARADRLLKTAAESGLLTRTQASTCRKSILERLAADKRCRLGRVLVATGLLSHSQLRSLMRHDTYRRERHFSKLVLQHAIQMGKLSRKEARTTLEVQKTEYKQVGGTVPILDCLVDEGVMNRATYDEVVGDLRQLMEELGTHLRDEETQEVCLVPGRNEGTNDSTDPADRSRRVNRLHVRRVA
jgi:hypothetical protein